MVNDPVANTLITIKNGYLASKTEITIPSSKLTSNLCKILQEEKFIESYKGQEKGIKVILKYTNREASLTDVKRISKPGLRVYKGVKDLPKVLNGLGIAIISTPKGLMTDKEARKLGLGGEVMVEVW